MQLALSEELLSLRLSILLFCFRMLSGYVEFDGYYLESDPCLVCNNPEVPFQVRLGNKGYKMDQLS